MYSKNYAFLVYMYYVHPGCWTSIFGKNRASYIQIFTVHHNFTSPTWQTASAVITKQQIQ